MVSNLRKLFAEVKAHKERGFIINPFVYGSGGPPPPPPPSVYPEWNPADKQAGVILTSGNRNGSYTSRFDSNMRATLPRSTGKFYAEQTLIAVAAGAYIDFGIWPISFGINTYSYLTAGLYRLVPGTRSAGDVFGVAFDADTGGVQIYRNGVFVANGAALPPSTNGALFVSDDDQASGYTEFHINAGQDAFAYAMPVGYSNWAGAGGTPAPPPAGVTYATWSPVDKAPGAVLTNSNNTHTGVDNAPARSTIGKAAGKWYWEMTSAGSRFPISGIGTSAAVLNWYPGQNNNSYGFYGVGGGILHNDAYVVTGLGGWGGADLFGVCLNMDTLELKMTRNGADMGFTIALAAGTWFAMAGGDTGSSTSNTTVNFGASAFTYAPPVGFNAGLYV